ncbi:hypothetical protein K1720_01490 [Thermococcus argininiproducens]|uniref:Uncharacterized protein n=1 Tax=Thermococcus argininiproducens TaxID=2866384 RepID=A0A9E7SDM3_9EURY|nr:hypothetical protein [Thermococcus argininiproducens]USH00178.1 hypothetical protein K1720_01490 [Thermococcus argininiproducens]
MKRSRAAWIFLIMFLLLPLAAADEDYENNEAQFGELAGAGFIVITAGIVLYSIIKGTSFVEYRKGSFSIELSQEMSFLKARVPLSLLDIHHILVVIGSLLTLPHFISCQDYSTPAGLTGLLLGFILLIENVSGFYGRYLHAKVEKLRREVNNPYLKGTLKKFRIWRELHIAWTLVMYFLLVLHVIFVD